jgi:hypothetical protein
LDHFVSLGGESKDHPLEGSRLKNKPFTDTEIVTNNIPLCNMRRDTAAAYEIPADKGL